MKLYHRLLSSTLLWWLVRSQNNTNNTDLIFSPPASKGAALPEKLLLFIQGAHVATGYYASPLRAIQGAANLRLWAVAPAVPDPEVCIDYCAAPDACDGLQGLVASALAQAVAAGFGGSLTDDVVVAGHSLGSQCAANLALASVQAGAPYAAAVVMGGYVPGSDVAAFPLPVLSLNAELDGGYARPGFISLSLRSSDAWTSEQAQPLDGQWQLSRGPVVILPGLDHSSFCPGYSVPGDVFPAEATEEASDGLIGTNVAAFLHLQTDQPTSVEDAAVALLQASAAWTRDLLAPLFAAIALERAPSRSGAGNGDAGNDGNDAGNDDDDAGNDGNDAGNDDDDAPWCRHAQHTLAGLVGTAEDARLEVASAVYLSDTQAFEDSRVEYQVVDVEPQTPSSSTVLLNISGHNAYYQDATDDHRDLASKCVVAAKELACKMASAARVADALNITNDDAVVATCRDINAAAIAEAESLLGAANSTTLARFKSRGRPICLADDEASFNGPLFVKESLSIADNGTCLVVTSRVLGPTSLRVPKGLGGTEYCKLLSPARVIDYMMTDSLKNTSTCLNV